MKGHVHLCVAGQGRLGGTFKAAVGAGRERGHGKFSVAGRRC